MTVTIKKSKSKTKASQIIALGGGGFSDQPYHKIRIEKFIWCIRIFQSRTLASEACN